MIAAAALLRGSFLRIVGLHKYISDGLSDLHMVSKENVTNRI